MKHITSFSRWRRFWGILSGHNASHQSHGWGWRGVPQSSTRSMTDAVKVEPKEKFVPGADLVTALGLVGRENVEFHKRLVLMRRSASRVLNGTAEESPSIKEILELLWSRRFTAHNIKRLFRKQTKLMFADVNRMAFSMDCLKKELELDDEGVKEFLMKDSSALLTIGIDRFKAYRKHMGALGFTKEQVDSMTVRHPHLLSYSRESMIKPRFNRYLELGMSQEEAVEMFSKEPSMFGKSYAKNIGPKIQWFEDHLGVSRDTIFHEWLVQNPAWVQSSLSVYKEKYNLWKAQGLSKEEVLLLLGKGASILHRSGHDVLNKVNFMKNILWKRTSDIAEYPECFQASYENKLTMRVAFLDANGQDYQKLSLRALLSSKDGEFCLLYANSSLKDLRRFISYWKGTPRDKKLDLIRAGLPRISEI